MLISFVTRTEYASKHIRQIRFAYVRTEYPPIMGNAMPISPPEQWKASLIEWVCVKRKRNSSITRFVALVRSWVTSQHLSSRLLLSPSSQCSRPTVIFGQKWLTRSRGQCLHKLMLLITTGNFLLYNYSTIGRRSFVRVESLGGGLSRAIVATYGDVSMGLIIR